MPISHFTKVFATADTKLYPITADPVGGTTTYGAGVDVPGIKSVAIRGTVETKQLRGDNKPLDSDAVITDLTVSIAYAKLSLDVLSLLMGGAVTDSGVAPNQRAAWGLKGGSKPKPFKLEAVTVSADPIGGNVDFVIYNVKLNAFPELGTAEEDYATLTTAGVASPRLSDDSWLDIGINETAKVLTA